MTRLHAIGLTVVGLVLTTAPGARAADRQIRPFVGVEFAGDTTIVDVEHAASNAHATLGINAARLGEIVGFDVDAAWTPGFFENDAHLVLGSSVSTVVGDVVIAAPRRLTEYSLRLYFVAGGGIMRVTKTESIPALSVSDTLPTWDAGIGALGFVTNRVGLSWEVRRFQSFGASKQLTGVTVGGPERLSFWRASMAAVFRY